MLYFKETSRWLRSLSGLSLRSLVFPLALIGLVSLAGCSNLPVSLASGLLGKGPNVAANVQAGKTNTQTVGETKNQEVKVTDNVGTVNLDEGTTVKAEEVASITINETPVWLIVALVLGWLLPSPNEIGRSILRLFTRRR